VPQRMMFACMWCLRPTNRGCAKCIKTGTPACIGFATYCSVACQTTHWNRVHRFYAHDNYAIGVRKTSSKSSFPVSTHPSCSAAHIKADRDDPKANARILGDALLHFKEELADVAVITYSTPGLVPDGDFNRPEIKAGIYAIAPVPTLIEQAEARRNATTAAARKRIESKESSVRVSPGTFIFFENTKRQLSKELTAANEERNKLHKAVAYQFIEMVRAGDSKPTAAFANKLKRMVPELASVYKIHLNPRQQYILGVVKRLLYDREFADTFTLFKVNTDPACGSDDENGDQIPPIVIYCHETKEQALRMLNVIIRIFGDLDLRTKADISLTTAPRYSARVDPLIWWANGDGDLKAELMDRIKEDPGFAKIKNALYNEDLTAFNDCELI
jgi:hypothetical protein